MRTFTKQAWLPLIAILGTVHGAQAAFNISVEAPGVLNSTATFDTYGIETFDSNTTGSNQTFSPAFSGTGITGTFSGVNVVAANQYGGAGGTGNYVSPGSSNSFSMTLDSNVTYFGLWISALDGTNDLTFFNGGTLVKTFTPSDLLALVSGNHAYYGNPSGTFVGQDSGEPFAFVNFYDIGGTFNKVVVTSGGYESDNYTVGTFTSQSGTAVGPTTDAPEPISLALLGTGLAGLGLAKRRKSH